MNKRGSIMTTVAKGPKYKKPDMKLLMKEVSNFLKKTRPDIGMTGVFKIGADIEERKMINDIDSSLPEMVVTTIDLGNEHAAIIASLDNALAIINAEINRTNEEQGSEGEVKVASSNWREGEDCEINSLIKEMFSVNPKYDAKEDASDE